MTDDRLSPIARQHLAQCRVEVEAAKKRAAESDRDETATAETKEPR